MTRLARAQSMLRHITDDPSLAVRFGAASAYWPGPHVVELAEETADWADDVFLGVVGHEGAHAALSRYHDGGSTARLPNDERGVLNWFEDQRVNNWLRHQLPGLADGVTALDNMALDSLKAKVGVDLGLVGPALPAHVIFIHELRARAAGRAAFPCAEAVEVAIADCLPHVIAALKDFPGAWRATEKAVGDSAGFFLLVMRDRVLPRYRELKILARRVAQQAPARGHEARLDELSRRLGDARWSRWSAGAGRALGRVLASSEMRQVPSVPASLLGYDKVLADVGKLTGRFVARLEDAFVANQQGGLFEFGYPSGERLDLRQALQLGHDPDRLWRLWGRRTPPDEREWRLVIAADTSSSMAGQRMEALQRVVVLLLEAAERLGVPTALILFGHGLCEGGSGVTVVKDLFESLRGARQCIEQKLFGMGLGSETPLAAALDRCRHVLGESAGADDLIVVITDGYPRWTVERFYAEPVQSGPSMGDDGKRNGATRKVSGRIFVWEQEDVSNMRVAEALARLEKAVGRHVLGVGIGDDAPVENWFRQAVHYADADAFANDFPGYVERWLDRAAANRR